MSSRRAASLVVFAAIVACAPHGHRVVPYQSQVQNVRTRGAETLRIVMDRDDAVRRYVEQNGEPDFLIVTDRTNVELIYTRASRLVHFHQVGSRTSMGVLSPLPLEVTNVLPVDVRAGTPGPISRGRPLTGCWHVDVGANVCRTCCNSPLACAAECQPASAA
jgi:hypothetical protein